VSFIVHIAKHLYVVTVEQLYTVHYSMFVAMVCYTYKVLTTTQLIYLHNLISVNLPSALTLICYYYIYSHTNAPKNESVFGLK